MGILSTGQDLATRHLHPRVRISLKGQCQDAGRLVGIHGRPAQNLKRAREEVLKLDEKERSLVSGDWVRKVMVDHDGVVAALIRSMPKQLAVRISLHDPDHADRELIRWLEDVALATLSKTDRWNRSPITADFVE